MCPAAVVLVGGTLTIAMFAGCSGVQYSSSPVVVGVERVGVVGGCCGCAVGS